MRSPLPFDETAYRKLWAAVLVESIKDLDSFKPEDRRRSWEWIENSTGEPGSFEWVCTVLELPINRLRMSLISRQNRKMAHGR